MQHPKEGNLADENIGTCVLDGAKETLFHEEVF